MHNEISDLWFLKTMTIGWTRDGNSWIAIEYKYKAMNGPAPSYMKELCVPVTTVATRSALRSAVRGDLLVPRTRRQLRTRQPGILHR